MPFIGQAIPTKHIWLMDGVMIRGVVKQSDQTYDPNAPGHWLDDNFEIGPTDSFFILPDDNYRHLTALFPGNRLYFSGR